MKLVASVQEHGDHVYITSPVQIYSPEDAEIETFAFAKDLRAAAPNPKLMWLKGQYVEADRPNRNSDEWSEGELVIKALTPVLMPITVMHDLRSAVGTIADARLFTPAADNVPRARIESTLAVWAHRFPEVAAECKANADQGTLMQSMECLSPYFECTHCGAMMQRDAHWQENWRQHAATHTGEQTANTDRPPARKLRSVTFTGVGLIFGTRGAKGAMPDAHLEVEELAAMHREAHASTTKRPRRKNTVEIEDSKYEQMVAAKAEADSKITTLTAEVAEKDGRITTLEAENVKLQEDKVAATAEAEAAKEQQRVAAMRDERLEAFGAGFRARLDKMTTTAKVAREQAGTMTDEQWAARLAELEEAVGLKVDAAEAANDKSSEDESENPDDKLAGLLFDKQEVASSAAAAPTPQEVTASTGTEPSVTQRQSVMGGLIRNSKPQREIAKA